MNAPCASGFACTKTGLYAHRSLRGTTQHQTALSAVRALAAPAAAGGKRGFRGIPQESREFPHSRPAPPPARAAETGKCETRDLGAPARATEMACDGSSLLVLSRLTVTQKHVATHTDTTERQRARTQSTEFYTKRVHMNIPSPSPAGEPRGVDGNIHTNWLGFTRGFTHRNTRHTALWAAWSFRSPLPLWASRLAHGFLPIPGTCGMWNPAFWCILSLCVERHDSVQGMVDHGNTTVEHDCQLGSPLDPPEGGIAYKGGRPAGTAPSGEPTFVGVAGCLGAAGLGEAGGLMGSGPMPS